jgi:hypothetical protein
VTEKNSSANPRPHPIFYGYPAFVIEEVCMVSKVTACAWKAGKRKPSKRALRLFELFAQGRVVPKQWDGWRFNSKTGELVSPDGWAFDPGRIRAMEVLFRNGELRRDNPMLYDGLATVIDGTSPNPEATVVAASLAFGQIMAKLLKS